MVGIARLTAVAAAAALVVSVAPQNTHAAARAVAAVELQYVPGDSDAVVDTLVIDQGDTLTFANLDALRHSLTSSGLKPGGGRLFDSTTIMGPATHAVTGVNTLAPGRYEFFCTTHGAVLMRGFLVVT